MLSTCSQIGLRNYFPQANFTINHSTYQVSNLLRMKLNLVLEDFYFVSSTLIFISGGKIRQHKTHKLSTELISQCSYR
jgi:hypothetical protein